MIDPMYVTRLCEQLGNIAAIEEFIRVWSWRITVPDEMIERLTFEECRTILEWFRTGENIHIHHRTRPNSIKRQAVRSAKTFQEFKYLADQPYSFGDRGHQTPACIGMANTASSFEECLEALNRIDLLVTPIQDYGNSYNVDQLVARTLEYAKTSEEYARLLAHRSASNVAPNAIALATQTATTARDCIRIFRLDSNDPQILVKALDLPGTDNDFIEIALSLKTPSARLQALKKAMAILEPEVA